MNNENETKKNLDKEVACVASFEFSKLLSEYGVTHLFTQRYGGTSSGNYSSLNLGEFCGDNQENVKANRKIICNHFRIDEDLLFVPREIHEANVCIVDSNFTNANKKQQNLLMAEADALITNQCDVCVGVTTADCVPVLLFDKKNNAVAAIHAGWRGVVKNIIKNCVMEMQKRYSTCINDIIAATGPCISQQVFEVGDDVIMLFKKTFCEKELSSIISDKRNENGKFLISLRNAVKIQLINIGLDNKNIEINKNCTFCSEKYFSARRDRANSGRILSAIMSKKL